jgi:hypothetical protein
LHAPENFLLTSFSGTSGSGTAHASVFMDIDAKSFFSIINLYFFLALAAGLAAGFFTAFFAGFVYLPTTYHI